MALKQITKKVNDNLFIKNYVVSTDGIAPKKLKLRKQIEENIVNDDIYDDMDLLSDIINAFNEILVLNPDLNIGEAVEKYKSRQGDIKLILDQYN